MKSQPSAYTLAEILVATALLGMILTISAVILNTARRGYTHASENAVQAKARDSALSALSRSLDALCFTQRPGFSADGSRLEPDSGQHFVCGPASELLPEVNGLCGDALFFQRQNKEGLTEATGFLVAYGDDAPWRPPSLPNLRPQRRFRLLQFQQPSQELTLYGPENPDNGSSPDTPVVRAATCQWFAAPLHRFSARNCHVIADNIIALMIDVTPGFPGGWDTRRFRWDGESAAAQTMKNRLPREITIHLLIADEPMWTRLNESEFLKLARELQSSAKGGGGPDRHSSGQIIEMMRQKLEFRSIRCQIVSHTIRLPS